MTQKSMGSAGSPSSSSTQVQAPGGEQPRVRYDRGIRIWGADGQDALEKSSICLLHAGPTGAEALKNLVLGGIRSFCVVDAAVVGAEDLGNNFMISRETLGRPRAEAVTGVVRGRGAGGSQSIGKAASLLSRLPGWQASVYAWEEGRRKGTRRLAIPVAALTGAALGVLAWGKAGGAAMRATARAPRRRGPCPPASRPNPLTPD